MAALLRFKALITIHIAQMTLCPQRGLLADVAEVLVEHGYARPGPHDMVALLAALHGFLYLREGR